MININEFRIGNKVDIGPGYDAEIYEIGQYKSEVSYDGQAMAIRGNGYSWFKNDDINPIPITSAIFENSGFSYKDGADAYGEHRKNGCNIYEHDDQPGFYHFSLGTFHGKQIEIKYVHQLQNLYFALTGEELEIPFMPIKTPSI